MYTVMTRSHAFFDGGPKRFAEMLGFYGASLRPGTVGGKKLKPDR
jgi:hypothetical protein